MLSHLQTAYTDGGATHGKGRGQVGDNIGARLFQKILRVRREVGHGSDSQTGLRQAHRRAAA